MKKLLLLLLATIVALGLLGAVSTAGAASLNNFVISDYNIQMKLTRDKDGRSVLEATETITAQFSQADVNRGIERAIPMSYDGHSTSLKIQSVSDESGDKRQYSTSTSNDNLILRIGDPDEYVRGSQTYVINYTQRDVTKYFSNTDSSEFYWDTNGTQWRVPVQRLTVSVDVDESIREDMTGNNACYFGLEGSKTACALESREGNFSTTARDLASGENVTVALGFKSGTFASYELSLGVIFAIIWGIIQLITFFVMVILTIWLIVRFTRIVNRTKELKPIVPEYTPPTNYSVTVSAKMALAAGGSVMSAQLIDLAVRHYIKLYEVKQKKTFTPAEYEIEIIKDLSQLQPEEQELLKDMFGTLPTVSQRMNLKDLQNNTSYFKRTTDNDKKLTKLIQGKYALRAKDAQAERWFKKVALILLILAVVTLSIPLILTAGISFVMALSANRLTDAGLALRRYLEGLKMYIGVAETERLKMLQSPEGVQKVTESVGAVDEKSLLKLYEKVLPYAILFNQEKQWSKSLGMYYEQTGAQPDWYTGQSAFNAAMFSSSMGSLSEAASYASSSSSSSGGSSGGGSSGGGGGGGGGGGW